MVTSPMDLDRIHRHFGHLAKASEPSEPPAQFPEEPGEYPGFPQNTTCLIILCLSSEPQTLRAMEAAVCPLLMSLTASLPSRVRAAPKSTSAKHEELSFHLDSICRLQTPEHRIGKKKEKGGMKEKSSSTLLFLITTIMGSLVLLDNLSNCTKAE